MILTCQKFPLFNRAWFLYPVLIPHRTSLPTYYVRIHIIIKMFFFASIVFCVLRYARQFPKLSPSFPHTNTYLSYYQPSLPSSTHDAVWSKEGGGSLLTGQDAGICDKDLLVVVGSTVEYGYLHHFGAQQQIWCKNPSDANTIISRRTLVVIAKIESVHEILNA